ncbi:MAG: hypothetical protein JKY07_02655, partial [SAR324 cluster bacterium]|nr:hypothetical protein [SAR324 cluster bacterium]
MLNFNKILKPRYLLVLLVLGGGALFTMLQATSNECFSTTDGDLTEQSTFGTYNGSAQSGCGSNLALDYIISAGNIVSWSGFEGPISGNVEVKSGGSLDINGNATFGGTLTNAGALTVQAPATPAAPTAPTSEFYTISNISGHTAEDGTTSTFDIVLSAAPTEDVTVSVSSSNTSEGTVSPATLTFNSANYNVAQTVTVTGVNDADIDGHQPYGIIVSAEISGETWDSRNSGTTKDLRGVAYGNNVFVTVGNDGKIFSSTNGTTWAPQTSETDVRLNSITDTTGSTDDTSTTADTTPPTASVTTATFTNSGNAVVRSTETGTAYLVNTTVSVSNLASITGAADNQQNSVTISSADTDTNLPATGLADGTYKVY